MNINRDFFTFFSKIRIRRNRPVSWQRREHFGKHGQWKAFPVGFLCEENTLRRDTRKRWGVFTVPAETSSQQSMLLFRCYQVERFHDILRKEAISVIGICRVFAKVIGSSRVFAKTIGSCRVFTKVIGSCRVFAKVIGSCRVAFICASKKWFVFGYVAMRTYTQVRPVKTPSQMRWWKVGPWICWLTFACLLKRSRTPHVRRKCLLVVWSVSSFPQHFVAAQLFSLKLKPSMTIMSLFVYLELRKNSITRRNFGSIFPGRTKIEANGCHRLNSGVLFWLRRLFSISWFWSAHGKVTFSYFSSESFSKRSCERYTWYLCRFVVIVTL